MNGILKSACGILIGTTVLMACKKEKDDRVPNLAPETTVSVKEVMLADEANLTSTVHLYWSGSDQDGFVKSYQVSLDSGLTWSPDLTGTDSLFRFSFPSATPTARVVFMVRAVDEKQLADPTPAVLKLPLRNSAPTGIWDEALPLSDTVYSVIALPFRVADLDGNETIDSIYIRLNGPGNPWLGIRRTANFVAFRAEDPTVAGVQPARVYLNGDTVALKTRIQGFRVEGTNTFELRVVDIAKAESPIATITTSTGTERQFYVKRKTSDLLVLDSHPGGGTRNPDPVYAGVLSAVYPSGYDRIDMTVNKGANQPRLYDATMRILLPMYPKVFWYMDNSRSSTTNRLDTTQVVVESVARLLSEYVSQQGKHLLLSTPLPDNTARLPEDSPVYSLFGADRLSPESGNLRIGNRSLLTSTKGYPELQAAAGTTGADALFTSASADSLYSVPALQTTNPPYSGPKVIAIRARNSETGKVNRICFSVELHLLNQNPANFQTMFDMILNQEFNQ